MMLTVSPEAVIIVAVVVAAAYFVIRKIERFSNEVFDGVVNVHNAIDLEAKRSAEFASRILNGDKAILAIAQANNEALKLLCGKGGAMDAGKLGRTREALRIANEYAIEKGLDPADVGMPDLIREMGDDQ